MFHIKIAGLTIGIHHRYPFVRQLCEDYLTDSGTADFTVSVTEDEILTQQTHSKILPLCYCESLCIYRRICLRLPAFGGLLMHGAALAVDGQAYLFLAPSGMGKTTHMRLWMDAFGSRAQVVNDDKPILRKLDGQWHVCGTPWQGKEKLGSNRIVPLKALCFLKRGNDNVIHPVPANQITGRIFPQLLLPQNETESTAFFTLLNDLLAKMPCYLLHCNRDSDAALVAYQGMQPNK